MPSITYWNRVEPRARSQSIAESLAARVRDPLWMLTRQWQLGEFQGEDAGAAAFARVEVAVGRVRAWSPGGDEPPRPLPDAPLESLALAEGVPEGDVSLAAELGLVFERALAGAGGGEGLIEAFRTAFPLRADEVAARDVEASRFGEVVAGRVTDGVALLRAADLAAPDLPPQPAVEPADGAAVEGALDDLRRWVAETVGAIGGPDPPTWNPERLEYRLEVTADDPGGGQAILAGHPERDGRCEWYSFDARAGSAGDGDDGAVTRVRRSVIPGNVTFRGMPNARFWAFEAGTTNLGAIRPETREVAKLVVLDFLLVHGNDWYVLPYAQPLGSLARIESLVVHDVFGGVTSIRRAGAAAGGSPWTLFSTSLAGGGVTDSLLLPPTAGPAQTSDPREEVRFVRDEMANIAWGVERVVENAIGEPWQGHERSLAQVEPIPAPPEDSALRYRIQTDVPEHWTPFLPVAVDTARRDVRLERGVVLRSDEAPPTEPAGRILRPTTPEATPYRLREEELPPTGLRVVRVANRARWTDGSTHVWVARAKRLEGREERSGLLFDVAAPRLDR